ncbi:MAG: aminoacyl-tRNA hydrolase [Clostridia bacterium]|nr:aminoacyl-tRNA hydrolase [Clostridia bacterium]MBQ7302634.1 aminoacyl-tRNA hydrolase [Clostridia bacterium]
MFFRKKETAGPIDFLIVGLGNPGKEYEKTRHNAGCLALETLARKVNATPNRLKFKGQCTEATVGGHRVLLLFPLTYMNNSGESVAEAMRFYKLKPEQLLVFSDDISLSVGTVRVRRKGSDGGQKGLRSIIQHIGSDAFPRVKIGVGQKPHPDYDLAAWVLSRFTAQELTLMEAAATQAAQAAELIVDGQIDEAMNRFSR